MGSKSIVGAKKRVAPAHDTVLSVVGAVPAPETAKIIGELKCAIGHALLDLRSFAGDAKARAQVIRYLTQSIKDLVAIGHLEQLAVADLSSFSDTELKEHVKKVFSNFN